MKDSEKDIKNLRKYIEDIFSLQKVKSLVKIEPIKLFNVKELRGRDKKYDTLKEYPGIYKWWATAEEIKAYIKDAPTDLRKLEKKDDKYCIYVGKASDQSLRDRLKMHYNRSSGTSAIRAAVAEKIGVNQNSKDVSDILDGFYVSIDKFILPIKDKYTNLIISVYEILEINRKTRILNKQENYNK